MSDSTRSTRRRFLKQGVSAGIAVAAAPTIIPRHVLASADQPGANDRIGLGGIGIVLLSDVTKGLGTRPDEELLERFRLAGVEVSTLGELERGL